MVGPVDGPHCVWVWVGVFVREYVCCVLGKSTSRASLCPVPHYSVLSISWWSGSLTVPLLPCFLSLLSVPLPLPPRSHVIPPFPPSIEPCTTSPSPTTSPTMHFAMSNDEDPNGAVVSRLKRELFDLEEASVRNLQARKDMERQMDQLRQQVGGSWALRLRSVSVYPNAVCFVPDQHVPCSLAHSLSLCLSPLQGRRHPGEDPPEPPQPRAPHFPTWRSQ